MENLEVLARIHRSMDFGLRLKLNLVYFIVNDSIFILVGPLENSWNFPSNFKDTQLLCYYVIFFWIGIYNIDLYEIPWIPTAYTAALIWISRACHCILHYACRTVKFEGRKQEVNENCTTTATIRLLLYYKISS